MLIWAVFTLGYLFGVFFSLAIILKPDKIEDTIETQDLIEPPDSLVSHWKVFNRLIKPNFFSSQVKSFGPITNLKEKLAGRNSSKISPQTQVASTSQ